MTFHKYPKIKALGTEETFPVLSNPDQMIFVQEKIDGANIRFMPVGDGRIVFGSRTQSIGDSEQDIGGNWKRCVDFILEQTKDKDLGAFAGSIFYGECCVRHSLDYDWDRIPPYLGFDILDPVDGFVSADIARKHFDYLGLPMVPEVWSGYAKDLPELTEAWIPQSAYAPTQAEGVVLKNYNNQVFAKFVTSKFKEVNKDTFGKGKKQATNDDERLIATYCTNPRIDKCIFSLVNEGEKLDMPLMQWLPSRVWSDIVEEHAKDILSENWNLNLRNVRKGVSKRCVNVLQQVITNQALARGSQ